MRVARWTVLGSTAVFLLAAGCGARLHDERTVPVEPAEERSILLDPPTRDQTVRVQVDAGGTPVNVYCFLQKDQAEAEKAVRRHQASDKILAKAEKSATADLQFSVPAKEGAVVLLTSAAGKKASAKLTIDGR